jgi:hypothetical protein
LSRRETSQLRKNRTFRDGGAMYQIDAVAALFEQRLRVSKLEKLAAILAADIVGRLTGANKDRTLAS